MPLHWKLIVWNPWPSSTPAWGMVKKASPRFAKSDRLASQLVRPRCPLFIPGPTRGASNDMPGVFYLPYLLPCQFGELRKALRPARGMCRNGGSAYYASFNPKQNCRQPEEVKGRVVRGTAVSAHASRRSE